MPTAWKGEWKPLAAIVAVFVAAFYLPAGWPRFDSAVLESLHLLRWYAREHALLCLVPAFFIAGAIAVFVRQASVMKYLGARAPKPLAYGVASVAGTVLAVCSCTVLPLFAGIWRIGAGLGPATTFLYSGPAINVLAIVLTARVLGFEIGLARAVGAIVFSVVVGLLMQRIFRREETARAEAQMQMPDPVPARPLWQNAVFLAVLTAILVLANWGEPAATSGAWLAIYRAKWWLTGGASLALAVLLAGWLGARPARVALAAAPAAACALLWPDRHLLGFAVGAIGLGWLTSTAEGELGDWFQASWGFARQILPLLFWGILVAGLLLGRPGHEGLIPAAWVAAAVGGNSWEANFLSSLLGAFMYFATLTEIPILQGLLGSGMGKGPALALLLAGPALSLPSMLVLKSILGAKKTVVYVSLVVVMATLSGLLYGWLFA